MPPASPTWPARYFETGDGEDARRTTKEAIDNYEVLNQRPPVPLEYRLALARNLAFLGQMGRTVSGGGDTESAVISGRNC